MYKIEIIFKKGIGIKGMFKTWQKQREVICNLEDVYIRKC